MCCRNTHSHPEHPRAGAHRSPLTPWDVAAQVRDWRLQILPSRAEDTAWTSEQRGQSAPGSKTHIHFAGSMLRELALCKCVQSAQNAQKDRSSTGLNRWLSNICCWSLQVPSRAFLLSFTALAIFHGDAETCTRACVRTAPSYTRLQGVAVAPPSPTPRWHCRLNEVINKQ